MISKKKLIVLISLLSILSGCCTENDETSIMTKEKIISRYDSYEGQKKQTFIPNEETKDMNNGVYKRYRKDGSLRSIVPIKDGKGHGIAMYFFPNGQLDFEMEYKNGEADGYCKGYYRSGELFSEGKYKNNVMDGEWKYYNKDGIIIKIELYSNGQLIKEEEIEIKTVNDSVIS